MRSARAYARGGGAAALVQRSCGEVGTGWYDPDIAPLAGNVTIRPSPPHYFEHGGALTRRQVRAGSAKAPGNHWDNDLGVGQTPCGCAGTPYPGTPLVAGDERQRHRPEPKGAGTAGKGSSPSRVVMAVIEETPARTELFEHAAIRAPTRGPSGLRDSDRIGRARGIRERRVWTERMMDLPRSCVGHPLGAGKARYLRPPIYGPRPRNPQGLLDTGRPGIVAGRRQPHPPDTRRPGGGEAACEASRQTCRSWTGANAPSPALAYSFQTPARRSSQNVASLRAGTHTRGWRHRLCRLSPSGGAGGFF